MFGLTPSAGFSCLIHCVTHRFSDAFTLIAPAEAAEALPASTKRARPEWANRQNWLLLDESTNTGGLLRAWLRREGIDADPGMTLDSLDLIINLVALGMGFAFCPTARASSRRRDWTAHALGGRAACSTRIF